MSHHSRHEILGNRAAAVTCIEGTRVTLGGTILEWLEHVERTFECVLTGILFRIGAHSVTLSNLLYLMRHMLFQ